MQKIFFSEQSSKWKQSKWRQKQEEISTTFKFPFSRNKKQLVADSENLHQLQYLPNYQVRNKELGQINAQN